MTGLEFPRANFESVLSGCREIDLVPSRLEEKMRTAYRQMTELWNGDKGIFDLRTAAYVIALRRIAARYETDNWATPAGGKAVAALAAS